MIRSMDLVRLVLCAIAGIFRSKASLEAEILALRRQLNVLRRKSPGRLTFGNLDRLIFAGLYHFAPSISKALAVIQPETVIRWHRPWIPHVLAMEIAISRGPTKGALGNTTTH